MAQEKAIIDLIKTERAKRKKVSGLWLRTIREQLGTEAKVEFRASAGWFNNFLARNCLSLRAKHNNKSLSVEQRIAGVKKCL